MIFQQTDLKGAYLIDLVLREDERGFFSRYFCEREFIEYGLNTKWVQINNSLSKAAGTLRGLHVQRPPDAEVKLVRCISGSVWDVIVDLRVSSETYGKWFGAILSSANRTMMYVPEGFAHGFVSIEDHSEIIYLVSNYYNPDAELTLAWDDPTVRIDWPVCPKVISEKDKQGMQLAGGQLQIKISD
jgi:dTDP-4-dehydrorhamnose 3,5-epimerase